MPLPNNLSILDSWFMKNSSDLKNKIENIATILI